MRGSKAKAIRRITNNGVETQHNATASKKTSSMYEYPIPPRVSLKPNCARAKYQKLKKNVKAVKTSSR